MLWWCVEEWIVGCGWAAHESQGFVVTSFCKCSRELLAFLEDFAWSTQDLVVRCASSTYMLWGCEREGVIQGRVVDVGCASQLTFSASITGAVVGLSGVRVFGTYGDERSRSPPRGPEGLPVA